MTSHDNSTVSGLLEVPAHSLQPGMYVADLDRPWLETPFAVQGFYVRSAEDVALIAKHCVYVMVDPRRRENAPKVARSRKAGTKARPAGQRSSLKKEFEVAKADLESAGDAMRKVFGQLRSGGLLDVRSVERAIDPLIDSVLRNNDALAALIRIRARDDYLYNHSIANAVWAAILGRQLGLEKAQLKALALGAAVVDVGMTRLEAELTKRPAPLSESERLQVREHVSLGLDMLSAGDGVSPEVVAIVSGHHERHDGSGYPLGLEGMDIPLLARIVGLVDSYDAMITNRPHAKGRASFEAVQELADQKDTLFQAELVEQFMQAIGLFPTGSVVELNTGEVGVVVSQNAVRRLRPKVVVVLDQEKVRHQKLVVVDLAQYDNEGVSDLWIRRELAAGAHGIHPDEFFL